MRALGRIENDQLFIPTRSTWPTLEPSNLTEEDIGRGQDGY